MANIRQQIVDALETRMKTITTANGYSTTLKTVNVWEMIASEEADLPALLIRDTIDNMPDDGIGGRRDHELLVEVQVQLAGDTAISTARKLIADIIKAVGVDATFGDLAFDTQISAANLLADDANKAVGWAQIPLTIRYRSELWTI